MKKKYIIKSDKEFTDIIKNGKFVKSKEFVIYFRENNNSYARFGIAINTKIGNAVTRNKLKRQTREIITELNSLFKNNRDYIIMIRNGSLSIPFHIRLDNLKNLLIKEKI